MAYNSDITRTRGDSNRIIMDLIDPLTGRALNISAWTTFRLGIDSRKEPTDTSTNIRTLIGALLSDGLDGAIYFTVPDDLPVGSHYYDAQALDQNGNVYTFAKGRFTITQDRTK